MAVDLTDEQFALLLDYLDHQHALTLHPDDVGHTVALGRRIWREIHGRFHVYDEGNPRSARDER